MNKIVIPSGLNPLRAKHYKIPRIEADIFDWIVVTHYGFKYNEFNYSYPQIERELGVKRTVFNKAREKFVNMGWLKFSNRFVAKLKTQKMHFDIDYPKLLQCLPEIIDQTDLTYYKHWERFIQQAIEKPTRYQYISKEAVNMFNELQKLWNLSAEIAGGLNYDALYIKFNPSDKMLDQIGYFLVVFGREDLRRSFYSYAMRWQEDDMPRYIPRPKYPLQYFFSDPENVNVYRESFPTMDYFPGDMDANDYAPNEEYEEEELDF